MEPGLYDKTNGEVSRIPRLLIAYQKLRKATETWNGFRRLPEEMPEYPLIRRILAGTEAVVQTPRMGASETNERRISAFSASIVHVL